MHEKFRKLIRAVIDEHHDPWQQYNIDKLPAQLVKRHLYDAATRSWLVDFSVIKMEAHPFDQGSHRLAFRMKKISQAPYVRYSAINWSKQPNCVAKCYRSDDATCLMNYGADRDRCFNDVKLQHEAAHWADIFNAAHPPKRIDVIPCFVIEFFTLPGSPVMSCERYVDGHDSHGAGFVKHNSNFGYVNRVELRSTPQAFSAHSFYASRGDIMVVDIQGVGDLYTDPQIHSADKRFGVSDFGRQGMALFFVTFRRNPVCDAMHLLRFPLSLRERRRLAGGIQLEREQTGLMEFLDSAEESRKSIKRLSAAERRFLFNSGNNLHARNRKPSIEDVFTNGFRLDAGEKHEIDTYLSSTEKMVWRLVKDEITENKYCTEDDVLRMNLACVHYELALLEAAGKFTRKTRSLGVLQRSGTIGSRSTDLSAYVPDVSSFLVHIFEAIMLGHAEATLVLAKIRLGLEVSLVRFEGFNYIIKPDKHIGLMLLQLASSRGSEEATELLQQPGLSMNTSEYMSVLHQHDLLAASFGESSDEESIVSVSVLSDGDIDDIDLAITQSTATSAVTFVTDFELSAEKSMPATAPAASVLEIKNEVLEQPELIASVVETKKWKWCC